MRDVYWLRQEVERSQLHCFDGLFDAAVGRHEEHRNVRINFLLNLQNFNARQCGQPQIGNDEVVWLFTDFVGRNVPIGSFFNLKAGLPDRGRKHLTQTVFIFNE